jgi:hypothetical protein
MRVSTMPPKQQVSIRDIVNDIRSGMADQELMTKYSLSAKGLQRAFEKLVQVNAIAKGEIDTRSQSAADTIFFKGMRELPRNYLVIPIPIHEIGKHAETVGKIRDITEKGLGITGIEATVGDMKIFAIYPDEFVTVGSLSFKAVCRWMERKGPGDFVGGFAITDISADALAKLRQLIRDLTFGDN